MKTRSSLKQKTGFLSGCKGPKSVTKSGTGNCHTENERRFQSSSQAGKCPRSLCSDSCTGLSCRNFGTRTFNLFVPPPFILPLVFPKSRHGLTPLCCEFTAAGHGDGALLGPVQSERGRGPADGTAHRRPERRARTRRRDLRQVPRARRAAHRGEVACGCWR